MAKDDDDCRYVLGFIPWNETDECRRKRLGDRAERQDARRDDRADRQDARREDHEDRIDIRQGGRTERTKERVRNGATVGQSLGNLFGGLGAAASGVGCAIAGIGCPPPQAAPAPAPDLTTPLLAIGGLALVGGAAYLVLRS